MRVQSVPSKGGNSLTSPPPLISFCFRLQEGTKTFFLSSIIFHFFLFCDHAYYLNEYNLGIHILECRQNGTSHNKSAQRTPIQRSSSRN